MKTVAVPRENFLGGIAVMIRSSLPAARDIFIDTGCASSFLLGKFKDDPMSPDLGLCRQKYPCALSTSLANSSVKKTQ
jgi:hypothetical protein